MAREKWKDIIGYVGLYQISTKGNVLNKKRNTLLRSGKNEYGYHYYILWKKNGQRPFRAHRLVAIHFIKNPKKLKEVNHKDGNKSNNNKSNLEWATRSHNQKHAILLGLNPVRFGENAPHAKLSEAAALKILESAQSIKNLAKKYKVTPSCISGIKRRTTWKHLRLS